MSGAQFVIRNFHSLWYTTMAAKFIAEEGPLKGLVLPLNGGEEWTLGRDPEVSQLLVEDPTVSRKHLVCRSTPQGIIVENLSNTNPIEVNDEPVNGSRLLHHGDALKIGSGLFRFYLDTDAHVNDLPSEEPQQMMTKQDNITNNNTDLNSSPALNNDNPALSENQEEQKQEEAQTNAVKSEADAEADEEKQDSIFDEDHATADEDALAQIDFDLMEAGRWFLKVIAGPNTGAEFSMQPSTSYVIGTDPSSCDIVFHDSSVSRQHARLTVGKDDTVTIEDLKSRNGTIIDDEKLEASKTIPSNTVITTGTTSFVVLDREGKRDTIISPLLPSIVKVLQREEARKNEADAAAKVQSDKELENPAPAVVAAAPIVEKPPEKAPTHYGALILIAMITGILVVVGIGTTTLFRSQEVVVPQVNMKEKLDDALAAFPSVKYSFNKSTGRLLLIGHVLTSTDRSQLLYNLQGLTFIKSLDPNNIIIDEYIWQETNQVLGKNLDWRGVTIHSPTPGHFVLTGYLKTRKQSDQLSDYLSQNFPYLDLLDKKIVVEEDVVTQMNIDLQEVGLRDVAVQMNNGEVSLSGAVGTDKFNDLEKAIEEIKAIPGVRNVNNFVVELAPEQSVINLTSKYDVTGYSHQGDVNLNVVINGRILSRGDALDGMTITSIKPSAIFLEKDGTKYRIDYNK